MIDHRDRRRLQVVVILPLPVGRVRSQHGAVGLARLEPPIGHVAEQTLQLLIRSSGLEGVGNHFSPPTGRAGIEVDRRQDDGHSCLLEAADLLGRHVDGAEVEDVREVVAGCVGAAVERFAGRDAEGVQRCGGLPHLRQVPAAEPQGDGGVDHQDVHATAPFGGQPSDGSGPSCYSYHKGDPAC